VWRQAGVANNNEEVADVLRADGFSGVVRVLIRSLRGASGMSNSLFSLVNYSWGRGGYGGKTAKKWLTF
jgi:hypothetical protein